MQKRFKQDSHDFTFPAENSIDFALNTAGTKDSLIVNWQRCMRMLYFTNLYINITEVYIAVDIGSSKFTVSLFKNLLNPAKIMSSRDAVTGTYQEDIINIFNQIDSLQCSNIEAIGIAIPRIIDTGKNYAEVFSMQPDWEKEPIRSDFEHRYSCKVFIENDCTVSALAESQYVYHNKKSFIFIEWGEGLGASSVSIIGNKVHLEPIELSHQICDPKGDICPCGQRGCLNLYCTSMGQRDKSGKTLEELSENSWKKVIEKITIGMANLLSYRRTELIVFGGDIPDTRIEKIKQINQKLHEIFKLYKISKFKISKMGKDIELFGCIALIHNSLNRNLV